MENRTTESKIILAADRIFTERGYAATRMRDIATEAAVNLALINYYFKSKENLYAIIMRQKVSQLFENMIPYMNDRSTSLNQKIRLIVETLHDVISKDRNLPLFVFNELQKKDSKFSAIMPAKQMKNSYIVQQLAEQKPGVKPLHYIINLLSLIFYPYVVVPMMTRTKIVPAKEINSLLKERVQLIPEWMNMTLNINQQQNKNL